MFWCNFDKHCCQKTYQQCVLSKLLCFGAKTIGEIDTEVQYHQSFGAKRKCPSFWRIRCHSVLPTKLCPTLLVHTTIIYSQIFCSTLYICRTPKKHGVNLGIVNLLAQKP